MGMRWIRRHKTQSAAAVAVGAGALVMAFALFSLFLGGSTTSAEQPVARPTLGAPLVVAPDLGLAEDDQDPAAAAGQGFAGAGINSLTGLTGSGGISGIPKHTIALRVTSASPLAYVGYVVPTSLDNSTGTVIEPGRSWSMTTVGYGPPDYAQIFSLAGPAGVPVTCTITVDGKVTEQRTTSGPYDQLFCQG